MHGDRDVLSEVFAQAVFFMLGRLGIREPCWSSSELYN